jgi:hypothetical protein
MVTCFVAQLYGEKMNLPDAEAIMYKQSERWSFWFMYVRMNLNMRKVCGTPVSPQTMQKQDKFVRVDVCLVCVWGVTVLNSVMVMVKVGGGGGGWR